MSAPAQRPARRMPSVKAIHDYWKSDPKRRALYWFDQYWDEPTCYACSIPGALVRAHIVDRSAGGLDLPCNLILLCEVCHDDLDRLFGNADDVFRTFAWCRSRPKFWHRVMDQHEPPPSEATISVWMADCILHASGRREVVA